MYDENFGLSNNISLTCSALKTDKMIKTSKSEHVVLLLFLEYVCFPTFKIHSLDFKSMNK